VLGVDSGTAEEFYSSLVAAAEVLSQASVGQASQGRSIDALALGWGADVSLVQALVWERIMVASSAPRRRYFRVAGSVTEAMRSPTVVLVDGGSCEAVLVAARHAMFNAFDSVLTRELVEALPDLAYLEALEAPTREALGEHVYRRLAGLPVDDFVRQRRGAADRTLLEAQAHRMRGDVAQSIQRAYASTFQSLEAYLVETAQAVGDEALFTVTTRWTLATQAMTATPGLPSQFDEALFAIRSTIAQALGSADGTRFLSTLRAE
jgi:hypothetical protein